MKIFSFDGRIDRLEYLMAIILYCVVITITPPDFGKFVIVPLLWIVLASGAKRSHDIGKSGWLQLIPFYGIYLLFERGHDHDNKYGPSLHTKKATVRE